MFELFLTITLFILLAIFISFMIKLIDESEDVITIDGEKCYDNEEEKDNGGF